MSDLEDWTSPELEVLARKVLAILKARREREQERDRSMRKLMAGGKA